MTEPPVIDHDPDEPPRDRTGNAVYWANAAILAVLWLWMLTSHPFDWYSLALGVWSGGFLTGLVMDKTGNKTPKWMR